MATPRRMIRGFAGLVLAVLGMATAANAASSPPRAQRRGSKPNGARSDCWKSTGNLDFGDSERDARPRAIADL